MPLTSISDRIKLNNNVTMPWLGLGVFESREGGQVEQAIAWAFEAGYRSIDTAAFYGNERGVGKAVRDSGLPREEVFVTTKIWNDDVRAGRIQQAFDTSMAKLGLDVLDLYLIHWPVPGHFINAWQELEKIYESGRVRSIGVSNFMVHHLQDLLQHTDIVPAVNQIEFHPYLNNPELLDYCEQQGIRCEAWSPFMRGQLFSDPAIIKLAEEYAKTPAQIVLRWDLQHGVVTIPKSVRQERIISNADIFDFELSADDMALLDGLHKGQRVGPDPDDFGF